MRKAEAIRLRGVRQNNLKGFDLEIPIGKLVVVTGLSGAGKSSLVFETLHAEGQRRYVETFSPYTRQFLELMPEADVDAVENVRPSVAVKQGNTVKTSRSTVGTMTELCDRMKVWFAHAAELFDPATGAPLRAHSPSSVWKRVREALPGEAVCVAFAAALPEKVSRERALSVYVREGFTKAIADGALVELDAFAADAAVPAPEKFYVVADRMRVEDAGRARFIEAAATAFRFGGGVLAVFRAVPAGGAELFDVFSEKLVSPVTRRQFRAATPALFSFNSPLGACPRCRGFGRVITLDWKKIVPDENRTLAEGVFAPFSGEIYGESQRDLMRAAKRRKIPTDVPWKDLSPSQKNYVLDGDADWDESDWTRGWYGVKRFFDWLESTSYKMHVRVFLSRFRAYVKCPDCGGTRFREESLAWRWRGNTLPELFAKTADELFALLPEPSGKTAPDFALAETRARLSYLREVGLGFLTLDRQSRTLSGGEVQRVNLTACLGASLSNTLFILDEPSVGLHPRDLSRMVGILKKLVAGGNTVVVVEHDESVMRAADWLVEIGPRPGAEGGRLVYAGPPAGILDCAESVTGAWLSGRRERVFADVLRGGADASVGRGPALRLAHVTAHNLRDFACAVPLRRLVGLCGVSGSGKSTLVNNVLAQFAADRSGVPEEDDFELPPCTFESDVPLREIVLVDQAPLSKTPRSNPALYCGAWAEIRKLLAGTDEARAAGLTAASFSFNSGDGRCTHCNGSGWETVEMQFLSDVFVPCPVCEGRRFRDEILRFRWNGKNVTEILSLTIREALEFFAGTKKIADAFALLDEIGLGYLTLGQPLNTLSGGEAQRLKLSRFLAELENPTDAERAAGTSLLLLDEPTTGLHREDVVQLVRMLKRLVAGGNSVLVVEHHADVLGACDWLLELGPEGGDAGGRLVFAGTPADYAKRRK